MTDHLPPGRELDARIAEAMGWSDVHESKHPENRGRVVGKYGVRGYVFVPPYTTSWFGMRLMLEWMRAAPRRWVIRVTWHPSGTVACRVRARRVHGDGDASTPTYAVAMALLEAAKTETPI